MLGVWKFCQTPVDAQQNVVTSIMLIRSTRERIFQTLCFEFVGILLVTPMYAFFTGITAGESLVVIVLLSVAILVYSPLHNTIFDFIEAKKTDRIACQRPHSVRVFHAVSHEVSAVLITCPILVLLSGHTVLEALIVNVGLTAFYSCYTYIFHIIFDRLRPVHSTEV